HGRARREPRAVARHARGLDEVRGRDQRPRQRVRRVDQAEVAAARLLDAGRDAGELEASRGPHGHVPWSCRPAVSGKPWATLNAWTACPAAPLPRLSMAQKGRTWRLGGWKRDRKR